MAEAARPVNSSCCDSAMRAAALTWWRSDGVAVETSIAYGTGVGLGEAFAQSGRSRDDTFLHGKVQCRASQNEVAALVAQHLAQLGVNYVDLLTIHYPDGVPSRGVPGCGGRNLSATWSAFEAAVAAGQARAIGASSFSPAWLQKLLALGGTKPAYNQYRMEVGASPADLEDVLSLCAAHNVTVGGFSALSKGCPSLPAVTAIAPAHNRSAAAVCERWVTQQGCNLVVSSAKASYDADDLASTEFDLSASEMAALSKTTARGEVVVELEA